MFLEQGVTPQNHFLKYILGSILIIVASLVGQLPMMAAIFFKATAEDKPFPVTNNAIMRFFEPNMTLFLMLLSFVFALAVVFFVIKTIHKQTLRSVTTARPKIDWSRVFFSFMLWSFIGIATTMIDWWMNPSDYEITFQPIPFFILLAIGAIMIPIQTTTEEYVFRGYLMQGFANLAHNKWFPLLMTSLLFGGMHWFNPEVSKIGNSIMIYYIGTGFFLGIITLMDEGMELALGFHAANNLIGALLVTSDWTVFQTNSILKNTAEPNLGIDVILPVILIYPILLLIFGRKFHWENWKEKLTGTIA
ncbi:CPBP family intramembrane glutamic endopeptidase [Flavobacterium sp. RSSA_27]|uniref:CPBP family intramembrane glutamic endopeptidase n=1 Tax=Flavobacterium sp. RSSA_27 TaxID=3447667 RepID=UPI003F2CF9B8